MTQQLATISGFSVSLWIKVTGIVIIVSFCKFISFVHIFVATSSAPIFERIYNAFEVGLRGNTFYATVRNSQSVFYNLQSPSDSVVLNEWTRILLFIIILLLFLIE